MQGSELKTNNFSIESILGKDDQKVDDEKKTEESHYTDISEDEVEMKTEKRHLGHLHNSIKK